MFTLKGKCYAGCKGLMSCLMLLMNHKNDIMNTCQWVHPTKINSKRKVKNCSHWDSSTKRAATINNFKPINHCKTSKTILSSLNWRDTSTLVISQANQPKLKNYPPKFKSVPLSKAIQFKHLRWETRRKPISLLITFCQKITMQASQIESSTNSRK